MSARTANKLRRLALFPAFFLGAVFVFGQETYWQQEVRYKIDVTLNDSLHTLRGREYILYKNNSSSALQSIYMHLWPNAYRNGKTALAKQLLAEGRTELYYASEKKRGYIDSLNFSVDGKTVKWQYDQAHIDICEIILGQPLAPGDSVVISTPFFVKIPDAEFSRLGHTLQAYYMTQWYPKPAVFDVNGWHPMPYLDQGEFYSEFGSFDVSITLPSNYVLAATGDRVNAPEELEFLNNRIDETTKALASFTQTARPRTETYTFPPSDKTLKTVRFVQKNVHDFAWFADKRFRVMKGNVSLESGRTVDTWIYFTPDNTWLWKDALEYVNKAVLFYSRHVGEYPYRHASAVDGTIMAGGGMEYPNITVIGNASNALELDMTITHEVGHNWFYGMLGNNERRDPFLDEGLNSFYELLYIRERYGKSRLSAFLGLDSTFRLFGLKRTPLWRYHGLSYELAASRRSDQPMNLSSEQYTSANYGSVIYSKTAVVMDYLMQVNGSDKMERAVKKYFSDFHFKHPQPKDFQDILLREEILNAETYTALFNTNAKIDYRLSGVRKKPGGVFQIKFRNRGDIASPFVLNGIKGGQVVTSTVMQGFKGKKVITVDSEADAFSIDAEQRMPELHRGDNYMATQGLFRRRRGLKIQFITAINEPRKRQLFFFPAVGANYYNGFMAGVALHNYGLLMKRFEWGIVPMYGFRSNSPAGIADFEYKFFPGGSILHIALGAGFRSFSFYDGALTGEGKGFAYYYKAAPYLEFVVKKEPRSQLTHSIRFTSHNMKADSTAVKAWNPFQSLSSWQVNEARYGLISSNLLHRIDASAVLQQSGGMVKLGASVNYEPALSEKYSLPVRFFGGIFLSGSDAEKSFYAFRASGYNGFHDYTFSHYFVGRNEHSGVGFSQFADTDGNLKVWTPYGQSTTWLVALNVKSPFFVRFPLRVFADAVFCDKKFLGKNSFLWDAGLNLSIVRDIIDIYYSVVQSEDITQALDNNNVGYANRLRFTFNINKLVPKRLVREIGF